ncbi:MAG: ATP-binding protein [Butyricicoccus sp.]|nr:ATP-binding protein [Butyricicoccus sp.]
MQLKEYDLAKLCREAVQQCRAACAARGREVELAAELPDTCFVVCDRTLVLRALLNLLTNALCTRGVTRVAVRLTRGHGQVNLVVSDNGPGVPPEELSRLYHDWARPWDEADWLGQEMPCGLGLPLVRQVAGWHGGTLLLEPGTDGGTVFRLSFPDHLPPDPPQLGQSLPNDSLDLWELELSIL